MIFNYDYYSRFEQPSLLLCHPDDTPIGMLTDIEDYKLELKFNEVSKLSFDIYHIANTEYVPVPDGEITAETVGRYYIFKISEDQASFDRGYYEEIDLNGHDNDLTLTYYTEEVSYNESFDEIMERREILVEDLGYFIITDVEDESGEKGRCKSVSASSCEYELNYVEMPYINGTYRLYSSDNWDSEGNLEPNDYNYYIDLYVTPFTIGTRYVRENDEYVPVLLPEEFSPQVTYYGINDYVGKDCLLYEIMRSLPHWTLKQDNSGIASVTDPAYIELAEKYRTFSPDDKMTIYAFLKQKLQESYECFVSFDILNRVIEIKRYEDALTDLQFVMSENNFIDKCKIKTTIDDYTNALSVTASDADLLMSSVNPLGTSTLYNFKHDIDSGFITSEYKPVDVGNISAWYFYQDHGKYQHIYLVNGTSSPDYDQSIQYYQPTEEGTLAAVLQIWQDKYDNAAITYHGIDYDKWDSWVNEIDRIKSWATGDYYYATNADGTLIDGAMLVVPDVTKIAGSIQTKKELVIKWKNSYGNQYVLNPAPLKQDDIESVTVNDVEQVKGSDYIYDSNTSAVIFTSNLSANDTVVFVYNYVPAVALSTIKYYYPYYSVGKLDHSTYTQDYKSGKRYQYLFKKGKYGFVQCTDLYDADAEYFERTNAVSYDSDIITTQTIKWRESFGRYYIFKPAPPSSREILSVTVNDEEYHLSSNYQDVYAYRYDGLIGRITFNRDFHDGDVMVCTYIDEVAIPAAGRFVMKGDYNYVNPVDGQAEKELKVKWTANYEDTYTLDPAPSSQDDIESVTVNGEEVSDYTFDSSTGDITFDQGSEPSVGDEVTFKYKYPQTYLTEDVETYYGWNGSKFVEVGTKTDYDGHIVPLDNTEYFIKVYEDENSIAAKIDDIMSWINQHRNLLCNDDGDGVYELIEEPSEETSFNIIENRDEYALIDQHDEYGRVFCSETDNDFGGNISDTTLNTIIANLGSEQYVNFVFPTQTYESVDGVPGVVGARLVQTKVDLALEDVVSEVVGIVTTISGYTAQIKALYDVDDVDITDEMVDHEISQIYGFVADARASLVVALDKYRMLTADRELLSNEISNLATSLSFETFFANYYRENGYSEAEIATKAKALYSKLIRYLRQQTYNEENITIEDNMSSEEKQDQELELYKYAVNLLAKLINPTYTLDIDIEAFPFVEEYGDIVSKLDVGCIINIELQTGEIGRFNLIGISIDYDSQKITLKFGNHLNDLDAASVFENLQTSAASASAIVASNYVNWGAAVDATTQLLRERNSILDATLRGITTRNSSLRDNVTIDTTGIKCMTQSINADGDYVDDYGLWISNGVIMFTDNGWQSSKMAVGRMTDRYGNIMYGFNGDTILANTIAADKLVAGTLSSGSNMINDGSFESYVNNAVVSGGTNNQYKFGSRVSEGIVDPWTGYDNDINVTDALYVQTVTNDSDACLGVRYLYIPSTYRARYTNEMTVREQDYYTASFYCKPVGGTPTSGGVTLRILSVNNSGQTPVYTETAVVTADYTELSGDGWDRFSDTLLLDDNVYIIELVNGLDTACAFDGVMLEQSVMLNEYSGAPGENYAKYTIMDKDGLRAYGGKIQVFNNAGTSVISADSDGNLSITGVLTANSGSNIAGWSTTTDGFYKVDYRDRQHQDKPYPVSGLFVDGAKYSLVTEGGKQYFSFEEGDIEYPLLFTGYNASLGGAISSNNCNFYVDNDGYMKAMNATITGSHSNTPLGLTLDTNGYPASSGRAAGTSVDSDGKVYTHYVVSGAPDNIIVSINDLIIPEGPQYKLGYTYDENSGRLVINQDTTDNATYNVVVYSNDGYGATISYATMDQIKARNAAIDNAIINGASISDADIFGANITDAIINNAKITGTTLLKDADIVDCDIFNTLKIKHRNLPDDNYADETNRANTMVAQIIAQATKDQKGDTYDHSLMVDCANGCITIRARGPSEHPEEWVSERSLADLGAPNDSMYDEKGVSLNTFTDKLKSISKDLGEKVSAIASFIGLDSFSSGRFVSNLPFGTRTATISNRPIFLDGSVFIQGYKDVDLATMISRIYTYINMLALGEMALGAAIPTASFAAYVGAVFTVFSIEVGADLFKGLFSAASSGFGSFFGSLVGTFLGLQTNNNNT